MALWLVRFLLLLFMLDRIVDATLSICIAASAYEIVILLPTIFERCFYPVLFCNCSNRSKFCLVHLSILLRL